MTALKKALIILTSNGLLGDTGKPTGFYYDEMATPYWALMDAAFSVDIASIRGGKAPHDKGSYGELGSRPAPVQRFLDDPASMAKVENTIAIADTDPSHYTAVFLPGGHGTMWDFTDAKLAELIGRAWDNGAVIGAICHGPAGLVKARRADGTSVVAGLKVNSFTDAEELAVGLTDVVPFLLETELRRLGAKFEGAANFQPYAVRDGRLVTGQNPRSVDAVAALILQALSERLATAS